MNVLNEEIEGLHEQIPVSRFKNESLFVDVEELK